MAGRDGSEFFVEGETGKRGSTGESLNDKGVSKGSPVFWWCWSLFVRRLRGFRGGSAVSLKERSFRSMVGVVLTMKVKG